MAERVASAAEVEASDAVVDVVEVAVHMSVATLRCPSAVTAGLADGDGCVGTAVGDNAVDEGVWTSQLSVD